jgi:hypothetical protein
VGFMVYKVALGQVSNALFFCFTPLVIIFNALCHRRSLIYIVDIETLNEASLSFSCLSVGLADLYVSGKLDSSSL